MVMASTMVMVWIGMFVLAVVAFAVVVLDLLCPRLVKSPVTPTVVLNIHISHIYIYAVSMSI